MTAASILAFAGLCVLLAITPGPDTFLVLRFSLARQGAGFAASAGSGLGSLMWALAVALGLAALLQESAEAYRILKIIGGAYLVYLGITALIASRRKRVALETEPHRTTIRSGFFAGAVSTMLNPKVGLFFLAIAPQFVPHGPAALGDTMLLGGVDALIGSSYLVVVALFASHAIMWLKRPRVTRTLERVSAGILGALGIGTIALSATE